MIGITGIATKDLRLVVTGGARGIGAATARLLARDGARVMICDVIDDEGATLAGELGPGVRYQRLDVTSADDWNDALAAAEAAFGHVNALFNNAGILGLGSVTECTPDDFRRIIEVNLTGMFLGIRASVPALRRAGGGVIVNTSSTAGLQGYGGLAAYVASKWGLRGLTKAAALDLAPDDIRVVSVHPGPIRTPMTANMSDAVAAAQPIPRFGEADEVARMVRFLLTEASYSTGSEFVIDGGAVTGQVIPLGEE
ncbi:SDR family oxidoreductase [Croceicoccus ponticola]|uniref:SDR family oxidoreductase n=1 Tax=Croceicoccus ponticola TaxID=2217664 RepID=A0A437H1T1_9SPHN|nr:SDR family oxidoreductase [Croceicoccus ponticola]RVQ69607.1 SDR family oxidoreductase [Croceicoccus ponticola]